MQNALGDSLVNDDDCVLVSNLGSGAITGQQSSFVLLDDGLHLGLVCLVLLVSDFRTDDILLRGLDVCHYYTSYSAFF